MLDSGEQQPIRADWARTESLDHVRELFRAGPGGVGASETLEVRFLPWGVQEDYVIELDGAGGAPAARIEVRPPTGLARLTTEPEQSHAFFRGDDDGEMDAFWQSRCEGALP